MISFFRFRQTQALGVMPDGTSRFTCKGQTVYHFMGTSTFSEYTVVSEDSVSKVRTIYPPTHMLVISCFVSSVLFCLRCKVCEVN